MFLSVPYLFLSVPYMEAYVSLFYSAIGMFGLDLCSWHVFEVYLSGFNTVNDILLVIIRCYFSLVNIGNSFISDTYNWVR